MGGDAVLSFVPHLELSVTLPNVSLVLYKAEEGTPGSRGEGDKMVQLTVRHSRVGMVLTWDYGKAYYRVGGEGGGHLGAWRGGR